jgi:hypothetical protein
MRATHVGLSADKKARLKRWAAVKPKLEAHMGKTHVTINGLSAKLGVHYSTVHYWFTGLTCPSDDSMDKLVAWVDGKGA